MIEVQLSDGPAWIDPKTGAFVTPEAPKQARAEESQKPNVIQVEESQELNVVSAPRRGRPPRE